MRYLRILALFSTNYNSQIGNSSHMSPFYAHASRNLVQIHKAISFRSRIDIQTLENYTVMQKVFSFFLPIMQLGLNSILVKEIVSSPEREGTILGSSLALNLLSSCVCIVFIAIYPHTALVISPNISGNISLETIAPLDMLL